MGEKLPPCPPHYVDRTLVGIYMYQYNCCSPCHPVLCPLYLEPSLTLHNVLSVCEGATDREWLGLWLDTPDSKRDDIRSRYQTTSERLEAFVKEWLAHHPAPSWKGLARVLYERSELRTLQRLYKYLAGMYNNLTCVIRYWYMYNICRHVFHSLLFRTVTVSANTLVLHNCIREYGSTLYVGMPRGESGARIKRVH